MAGKKKQLTEKQITEVEPLGAVLSIEQIADYFGVAKSTFYRMCDDNPDILERYKKGRSRAIKDVANSLLSKARGGDKVSQMFYLKTQAGWKETSDVNVSQTTFNLTKDDLNKLSKDDLIVLRKITEKLQKND
jgi:hypothetical protein